MDKNEIFKFVIREMTETALESRRETCAAEEQQIYKESGRRDWQSCRQRTVRCWRITLSKPI